MPIIFISAMYSGFVVTISTNCHLFVPIIFISAMYSGGTTGPRLVSISDNVPIIFISAMYSGNIFNIHVCNSFRCQLSLFLLCIQASCILVIYCLFLYVPIIFISAMYSGISNPTPFFSVLVGANYLYFCYVFRRNAATASKLQTARSANYLYFCYVFRHHYTSEQKEFIKTCQLSLFLLCIQAEQKVLS